MRGEAVTSLEAVDGSDAIARPQRLTPVQWAICAVASLGFAFDLYEIIILSVIVRPALAELGGLHPGSPEFNRWVGLLFYVPFAAGGLFGLLGGYFTDRFGRRRILVWSMVLYSVASLASGFATSPEMLLALRCATLVGICVEYVAAVAWLAELFPNPRQRDSILGYTQAFTALGGLMVTVGYYLAVTYGDQLPAVYGRHEAWRYTLIFGALPTIPLAIARPFLPESPAWRDQRARGLLGRPSLAELFRPTLRRTTLVAVLMLACAQGIAIGVVQQVPRIVPGLAEVRDLPGQQVEQTVSAVHLYNDVGHLVGRLLFALLVVHVVSQRRLLRMFLVPSLVVVPLVFFLSAKFDLTFLKVGMLVTTCLMVAQMSFWWNYLPRVYPTRLRGTGESFAANIGGRLIGTAAAILTTSLVTVMPASDPATGLAYAAATVGLLLYGIGFVVSFWLPEPAQDQLPE